MTAKTAPDGSPSSAPLPAIRNVIVPVDGSDFSERAIDPATAVAVRTQAAVTLVRVASSTSDRSAQAELRAAAEGRRGPPLAWRLLVGEDAGLAVGGYAEELDGSLVCMSSHGRGWPSSAFVGSAAAMVLTRTDRPLLVVGPSCKSEWDLAGMLVACVDGEPGSASMLPTAWAWAAALQAHLTVVTVAEPAPSPPRPGHRNRLHGPQGDAEAYIGVVTASLVGRGIDVTGHVVWDPVGVAPGLASWLAENPVGLLAISSHSRRRRPETPLGHTALRIIHASPVPVLVVPLRQEDDEE